MKHSKDWEYPSDKEYREKERVHIPELDYYKRHKSYFCFDTQFECANCKNQISVTLAMHKRSYNKCETIVFKNCGDVMMCNKCYYGI